MIYLGAMGLSFLCMLPFILIAEAKRKMKPVFVGAVVLLAMGEALLGGNYRKPYLVCVWIVCLLYGLQSI